MWMRSRDILSRMRPPRFKQHLKEKAQAYKDYPVTFFDLYLKGDEREADILRAPDPFVKQVWHET